jgi:glucose-1-phosphate thymidylyltransferase
MLPYTNIYQKSMIPVHGKPLLEYIITGIKSTGILDFIVIIGYLKEQVIEYFQDGVKWDINIEYVEQKNINGTGGAILLVENLLSSSHFLATNGDVLVPYEIYHQVYNTYKNEHEDFILVSNYLDNIQKGCSLITDQGYLQNMIEKPPPKNAVPNWNNSGIYLFSKEIFSVLKRIKPSKRNEIELPDAILTGIREKNWRVRVIKMKRNQFRGDFGDKLEYERLKKDDTWLAELSK